MPQPAGVQRASAPHRAAYRRAWKRIIAEQAAIANDPNQFRRQRRLDNMARLVAREMDLLDDIAAEWIRREFPKVYGMGIRQAARGLNAKPVFATIHQDALAEIAADTYSDLLKATQNVRKSSKEMIRKAVKAELLTSKVAGESRRATRNRIVGFLEKNQIHAIRYANGAKWQLDKYVDMALAAKSATAFNLGSLNEGTRLGVTYYEVFDGKGCGWTAHYDGDVASGKIVSASEARQWPISHPNCQRAFGPRPDVTKRDTKPVGKSIEKEQEKAAEAKKKAEAKRRRQRREEKAQAKRALQQNVSSIPTIAPTLPPPPPDFFDKAPKIERAKPTPPPRIVPKPSAPPAGEYRRFKTSTEMEKWGLAGYGRFFDELTPVDRGHLNHYVTSFDSGEANGQLRATGKYFEETGKTHRVDVSSMDRRMLKGLDDALEKAIVPDNVIAFRGAGGAADLKIGDEFTDHAFMSTSLNEKVAKNFVDERSFDLPEELIDDGGLAVFEVRVPKGTHGTWIDQDRLQIPDIDKIPEEDELLLARGYRFRVDKIDEKYGKAPGGERVRKITLQLIGKAERLIPL